MGINVYRSAPGPTVSAERSAYEYLRARIISGQLPGGSAVLQQDIADELGISRIPVRDAIKHLSAEGLVIIESNRRATVVALTTSGARESFLMSSVLEGLAAREAVRRMTPEIFERLETRARRLETAGLSLDDWLVIHEEFHGLIAAQSQMPRLQREIRVLRTAAESYLRAYMLKHGVGEKGVSHRPLVEALRTGNPAAAERAVREHVEHSCEVMLASLVKEQTDDGAFPNLVGETSHPSADS